jgi:hypothetical protein
MEAVIALDAAVAIVLLLVVLLLALFVRRRWLQRDGGTFECCLRPGGQPPGKGWAVGLARYQRDAIEWYRLFSLSPRAGNTVSRRGLSVRSRRRPEGPESFVLPAGAVIIECSSAGRVVELAMSEGALTGFLSWLEAAPPGQDVNVA